MTIKQEAILILLLCASVFGLGAIAGKHLATRQIQTVNVDHDVIHNNIITVTHTIHEKDGVVDTTTTTTDHTSRIETDTKTIPKPLPNWLVSGTYGTDIHTLEPAYGLQVNRRIVGNLFVGALLNNKGSVGLSLGIEF